MRCLHKAIPHAAARLSIGGQAGKPATEVSEQEAAAVLRRYLLMREIDSECLRRLAEASVLGSDDSPA